MIETSHSLRLADLPAESARRLRAALQAERTRQEFERGPAAATPLPATVAREGRPLHGR